MRDGLMGASGQAAEVLCPIALPTLASDDPLAKLFRNATSRPAS
jgi:hypothetical protein